MLKIEDESKVKVGCIRPQQEVACLLASPWLLGEKWRFESCVERARERDKSGRQEGLFYLHEIPRVLSIFQGTELYSSSVSLMNLSNSARGGSNFLTIKTPGFTNHDDR